MGQDPAKNDTPLRYKKVNDHRARKEAFIGDTDKRNDASELLIELGLIVLAAVLKELLGWGLRTLRKWLSKNKGG